MARKILPGPRNFARPPARGVDPWLDPDDLFSQEPGDAESVACLLGINGRVSGDELLACCPMHTDSRPSFGINLSTGAWHCFRGCGNGGGSLAWLVALATGVSSATARAWLEGVKLDERAMEDDTYDIELNEWYDRKAWRDLPRPPAEALQRRGVSAEAADELSIRWGKAWNPEIRSMTWASGWMLPVRQMVSFEIMGAQTKIDKSEFKEDIGVWNDKGTRKKLSLFGVEWYNPGTPVVLVESPLDVAVLRTAGIEGGLATYGKPSRQQLRYLAENTGPVVLAMDNDDAGQGYLDWVLSSGYLMPRVEAGELFLFSYGGMLGAKDPGDMHASHAALPDGIRRARQVTIPMVLNRQRRRSAIAWGQRG
jgi:hypothetical protein